MTGIFGTSRPAFGAVAGAATTLTILLAAGCASASASDPGPAGQPAQSHSAVAAQDAASLFGALPAPPGAVRLTAAPAGVPALSGKLPPESPADPNLIEHTAWWSSTQAPAALLAWISAHPPTGTTAAGSSTASLGAAGSYATRDFAAAAKPGVISQQLVEASVSALPNGGSAVREDVIVTYLPTKPAAETIQAAPSLVVTPVLPMGQTTATTSTSPITVTDPAVIAEVTSLINGLAPASAGAVNCPMDNGAALRLSYDAVSGAPTTEVNIAATGCRGVTVTVGGSKLPTLSGGDQLAGRIMTIVGAHWQLTTP